MEQYDTAKAARVWQRVQNSQTPPAENTGLSALIYDELQDAAVYRQLANRMGQREGSILRRLYDEEQAHAACLKGIHILITGSKVTPQIPQIPQESVEMTLRRCYGREMRCLAQYEARSDDPEYGPVFSRLAAQEREHCLAVLEILGRLKQ